MPRVNAASTLAPYQQLLSSGFGRQALAGLLAVLLVQLATLGMQAAIGPLHYHRNGASDFDLRHDAHQQSPDEHSGARRHFGRSSHVHAHAHKYAHSHTHVARHVHAEPAPDMVVIHDAEHDEDAPAQPKRVAADLLALPRVAGPATLSAVGDARTAAPAAAFASHSAEVAEEPPRPRAG